MRDSPNCTLDHFEAIVRVRLSDGCIAFPEAREQDLCAQHLHSIEPRGEMCVTRAYNGLEAFQAIGAFTAHRVCEEHGD